MKSYFLNSIDKKYCHHTEPRVLKSLAICIKCNKIPLPSYRSAQDLRNIYCRKCYEEQNFDPNYFIESMNEEFILEKLVLNCKYEDKGCQERHQLNTLKYLMYHEKLCQYKDLRKYVLKQKAINIDEIK